MPSCAWRLAEWRESSAETCGGKCSSAPSSVNDSVIVQKIAERVALTANEKQPLAHTRPHQEFRHPPVSIAKTLQRRWQCLGLYTWKVLRRLRANAFCAAELSARVFAVDENASLVPWQTKRCPADSGLSGALRGRFWGKMTTRQELA